MAGGERDDQPDLSTFGPTSDADSDAADADSDATDSDSDSTDSDSDAADSDSDATDDGPDEREITGVSAEADVGDIDARDGDADTDVDAGARPRLADLDREERVELGVDLLAHLERESLSLPEALDRIETITTNPALTRKILDTAELRGVVAREEGRIRTRRGSTFVRFEAQVVRREGDYECRRCGAGLRTGHFVRFETGELGPFGPECVRRVLGRT